MLKTILSLPGSFILKVSIKFSIISQFIKAKLNQRTLSSSLSVRGLLQTLIVSLATLIVAFIIQPFGISEFTGNLKPTLLGGMGMAAFLGMSISLFGLPMIFKKFYNRENWNVSKSLLGSVICGFFFGLITMVYGNQTGLTNFDLPIELLKFTAIIGAIALVYNFVSESILNKKYTVRAESITKQIIESELIENKSNVFPVAKFTGSNDVISLIPNQLIQVQVSKYSSEFVYQNLFGVAVKTLDITSEKVVEELRNYEQFKQLNKNTYVNKNAILFANGDAAGITLKIHKIENTLRVENKFLKNI